MRQSTPFTELFAEVKTLAAQKMKSEINNILRSRLPGVFISNDLNKGVNRWTNLEKNASRNYKRPKNPTAKLHTRTDTGATGTGGGKNGKTGNLQAIDNNKNEIICKRKRI